MAQTDVVVLVLVDVVEPVTDGALGQVIDWASFIDGCDPAALNRQLIDLELNLIPLCLGRRLGPGFAQFYDPVDGKLHYGPIWDFDVGFGNDGEGKAAAVTGWYIKNGFWTYRMFEDPLFVQNVIERWNEKKEALDASVEDLLTLADNDSVSAECNFMKWDILGKKVHMDSAGFEERLTYESEVEYMKTWLEDRIAWIDAALNDSYFISYELDGGSLPVSNPDMFLCGDTEEFQLNNPVREGYVFAGWSGKGIDGMSETVRLTDDKLGDREYKANWKKDIAFGNAHLAESEVTYSGAELTPDVIVTLNDETLTPEKDYVVRYEDNIDVGPATVTITGTGDYGGILEMAFTITPAPLTIKAKDQILVPVTGGASLCNGMSRNVELLAGRIGQGSNQGGTPAHDGLLATHDVEHIETKGCLFDGIALTQGKDRIEIVGTALYGGDAPDVLEVAIGTVPFSRIVEQLA